MAAHTEFWNKAAADYQNEFTAMTKLMTEMASKLFVAVQYVPEETRAKAQHLREAAE
jgi:hypothetical protein